MKGINLCRGEESIIHIQTSPELAGFIFVSDLQDFGTMSMNWKAYGIDFHSQETSVP